MQSYTPEFHCFHILISLWSFYLHNLFHSLCFFFFLEELFDMFRVEKTGMCFNKDRLIKKNNSFYSIKLNVKAICIHPPHSPTVESSAFWTSLFLETIWQSPWTADCECNCGLKTLMHACMLSCFSGVRLFATLWTVARQAPLSMGFSRQEHWSGLPCPPPKDLPDPGIRLNSFSLLHW